MNGNDYRLYIVVYEACQALEKFFGMLERRTFLRKRSEHAWLISQSRNFSTELQTSTLMAFSGDLFSSGSALARSLLWELMSILPTCTCSLRSSENSCNWSLISISKCTRGLKGLRMIRPGVLYALVWVAPIFRNFFKSSWRTVEF